MADRRYKPGRGRPLKREGKMSEDRVAWAKVDRGEFVILKHSNELVDGEEPVTENPEPGPTIRLMIPSSGRPPLSISLSALTHDEWAALKELFDLAFEISEPVVLERDKVAHEAFVNGDGSFSRVYRQLPKLFVRERAFGTDGQSLYDRSEGLTLRQWRDQHSDPGVREHWSTVAPADAPDCGGQDDGEKAY